MESSNIKEIENINDVKNTYFIIFQLTSNNIYNGANKEIFHPINNDMKNDSNFN